MFCLHKNPTQYFLQLLAVICVILAAIEFVQAQAPELVVQRGHTSAVSNVWLSPDKDTVISQSDERLIFWDLQRRKPLREVANVKDFFISPNNDIVATLDKEFLKLDLWKAKTGAYLNTLINFHDWSFSHDGERLVSGYEDGLLGVWDASSNQTRYLQASKTPIRNCRFGPQDRFVFYSTQDHNGTVYLVNTDSYKSYTLAQNIVFWSTSPDGNLLIAQNRQGVITQSEVIALGDNIHQKLIFSREGVTAWRFSPNGKYLMLADRDGSGLILEIYTGKTSSTISKPSPWRPNVWQLDFTPDGDLVYESLNFEILNSFHSITGSKPTPVQRKGYVARFGPDSKVLFIQGGSSESSFVWDMAKGQRILTMRSEPGFSIVDSAFSSDGQSLATIQSNHRDKDATTYIVSVWNFQTGEEKHLYEFKRQRKEFNFYNTGTGFGVGAGGPAPTFQPIKMIANNQHPIVGNLAFSNSKDLLVVGEQTGNVSICDVMTGGQRFVLTSHASPLQAFFTGNEATLNIYSGYNTYRLWNPASGLLSEEKTKPAYPRIDNPNEIVTSETKDGSYTLRYKKNGEVAFQITDISKCELSETNRRVLCTKATAVKDKYSVEAWDIFNYKKIFSQAGVEWSSTLSPDGEYVSLIRREDRSQFEVWNITKNKLKFRIPGSGFTSFSPDSKVVAFKTETAHETIKNLGVTKYSLQLWNLADEKQVLSLDNVYESHFGPDGRDFVAVLQDRLVRRELRTHKTIEAQLTAANNIYSVLGGVTFSRTSLKTSAWLFFTSKSGRREHESGVVFLWNTRKNQLFTLKEHSAQITSAEFSRDEKYLLTSSEDGTVRLWDTDTGKALLTLVLVNQSDWLVMTPEGFFDGTPSAWKQLFWRFNNNNLQDSSVEIYFADFFSPNVFQDVIAGRSLRAKPGQELERIDRRQPRVQIKFSSGHTSSPPQAQSSETKEKLVTVIIEVDGNAEQRRQADHPQTGGAQDVRLFRNGSLVKVWRGDVLKGQTSVSLETTIPIVSGENKFTAYAFNQDNVKSEDATLTITGAGSLTRKGTLHILAIGVGRYANQEYNLNYTPDDATSLAAQLKLQQEEIDEYQSVEVKTLLNEKATKENILAELNYLSRVVQPEDAVMIYFSGHGKASGDRFYLVPHDLGYTGRRNGLSNAGLRQILEHSISDLELEEAFRDIDAGQMFMIIDACNSGQALENKEEPRRGPMNTKGLAQLAYEKGMYILTASQNVEEAFVSEKLKHSYLTYALVEEGLKTKAADANSDRDTTLREWFDYATARVSKLREETLQRKSVVETTPQLKAVRSQKTQTPRLFYRREPETRPLIVARVKATQ